MANVSNYNSYPLSVVGNGCSGGACGSGACGPCGGRGNTYNLANQLGIGCQTQPNFSLVPGKQCNTCLWDPLYNPCSPIPLSGKFGRNAVTTWKINYLASARMNQAAHFNEDIINPWGIVVYNNQLWIATGSSDGIANLDLFGNKILATISVRDAAHNSSFPTGIAINCCGGFAVSNGITTKSSLLICCTEHGTVHSYAPMVDALNAFVSLNQQLTGEVSVYRGLAIANGILYLADFFKGHIDVFDNTYTRLLGFYFIDGDSSDPIPLDYGPNNIVCIGCYLYVLWAKRDPNVSIQDIDGAGNGYISVFNLDGSFVKRFTSRGVLNSPWALIPAPLECGFPPGALLVGNNGDGRINAFDCAGRYIGPLLNQYGLPIIIEGLWGLAPHYTSMSEIFFTSADDEDVSGLVGSLVKNDVIHF